MVSPNKGKKVESISRTDISSVKDDQSRSRQERADEARALQERQVDESSRARAARADESNARAFGNEYRRLMAAGYSPDAARAPLVARLVMQGQTQEQAVREVARLLMLDMTVRRP